MAKNKAGGNSAKKKKRRIVPEVSPVTGKKTRKYTAQLLPEDFLFTKREMAFVVTGVLAVSTSFNVILFIGFKFGLIGMGCALIVGGLGFSELRKDLKLPLWVIVFEAAVAISMLAFLWHSKEILALVSQGLVLIVAGVFIVYVVYYRKEEHREKFRERLERWEDKYYAREKKKIEKRQRTKPNK